MAKTPSKSSRGKFVNDGRFYPSSKPGGPHALCDTDADCAALAQKLKLDDQSGGPSPMSKASPSDKKKLAAYAKTAKP
jgi:hypothetical protein